ncbi:DNA polymerase [Paramuricea clavata]|uniref:DNA-directed DNA polymerase n=1 Tax=Paramuricea clavata TaxID=317549 RepID=A0A7D9HJE2_PARCT|nr:DNA polymerase [Paramuricea clavata]
MASSASKKQKRHEDDVDGELVQDIVRIIRTRNHTVPNYDISNEQIHELVDIIRTNQTRRIRPEVFSAELLHVNRRFNHNEFIYNINVGRNNASSLPDFLQSMNTVFKYLINVMNFNASSPTDKARFYISNAPTASFSTAILNPKIYKYYGKNPSESGNGRTSASKHGRETRNGVFQVVSSKKCFALSLLVGKSFLQKDKQYDVLNVRRNTELATLYTDAQIDDVYACADVPQCSVRIDQCHLFYENYLRADNIDLVIFSKARHDSIVYDSRLDASGNIHHITENVIFLWLNDAHFNLILSSRKFMKNSGSRFCMKCMKYFRIFENATTHVCHTVNMCKKCYAHKAKCAAEEGFKIECSECHVLFYNRECFTKHLTHAIFKNNYSKNVPACRFFFFCKTCYRIVPRMTRTSTKKSIKHKCGQFYCLHCNAIKDQGHACYMKPYKIPAREVLPALYFYDLETRLNDEKFMVPFYAVVQKVCSKCDEKEFVRSQDNFLPHPTIKHCDNSVEPVACCMHRQYVFENNNEDITELLISFMFAQTSNSVWIAHNGGHFDNIFLLRELLVKKGVVPHTVMNGNKIMSMEIRHGDISIKVIDSYLFLAMPLSKIPEAMDIPDLAKGYHPHFFTDLNYVGPMVGLEYFDLSREENMEAFNKWYEIQKTKTYIFRDAVYYYCRLDVDILRQGCVRFARLIVNITKIFPFYDRTCHTIAGLALKIYRANFLKEDVIGQIPPTGYGGNVNQSIIALHWLEEIRENLETQGYSECFESGDINKVNGQRFYVMREKTRRITDLFKDYHFTVVEKWECEYIRECSLSRNTILELGHVKYFTYINLNPCDALFGGRTSPAILFHDVKDSEQKLRYYDFTSLYPYVQKKYRYPTKHPEITRGVDKCVKLNVSQIFGLIKCKMLAPPTMLFPVLPIRLEKLTFALCTTCARNQCNECTHDNEQRALYGTWTSVEVHVALEHGYKILAIYEVYHYPHSAKIFDLYVDTFMKLKQESSGMPRQCIKDDGSIDNVKLQAYIQEYADHEQIYLDASKIGHNPGQRTVMKALLNSLWGKLAQNEDTTVVSFLDDFDDLLQLVNDKTIEVTSLDFISDNIARTTHRKISGTLTTLGNRNVVIASFVTAYARLELFSVLDKLRENVLYYDTDSVIYREDRARGKYLETGKYLGQLTDELSEKNCTEKWITEFCAAGPKSYSYRTNRYIKTLEDGTREERVDEVMHVKGFRLQGDAKKKLLSMLFQVVFSRP